MVARDALRLAELVEESLAPQGEAGGPADETRRIPREDAAELRDLSADLSALLVELARTPEEAVDVSAGWTPGLAPGDAVGRFVLRREIGRGGFGVVYEAHDRDLGRSVAFKALRPGRRIAGRSSEWLRAEAEAVAKLNHPNIVTLHDFGRGPSGPFLIFELLRGETLSDRLRDGPLPLREAVSIATDVARVLDHAHQAGVVHRDLKPANLFVCDDGAVKVLDFGLANLFGRAGAISGGTPSYMAPEQWRDEPGDERTDLFALGVLLFQMIAGRVPYRAARDTSEVNEPGPPPPLPKDAAPARLRRLVAALLEKDAADRPGSAREVLATLVAVGERMDGSVGRRRVAWAAVAAASAVAVAAALLEARRELPVDGERFTVAISDVENGTGERELDGLSVPLAISMEQSRRIQVLSRARLIALLRAAGRPVTARIEGELARELARAAGVRVLLAGAARRHGSAYALELSAFDPTAGNRLFVVREVAAAKADIFPALDRLSAAARSALNERDEEVQRTQIRVAQALTPNLAAYRAFFEGVECMERPSRGSGWINPDPACAGHLRRSLALDPAFALARYELALLLGISSLSNPEAMEHIDAALRYVDRVPPKEAALIRAWKAHLDGRDDAALTAYGDVLAQYPEETHALFLSGELLSARGQPGAAVPFFERALAVDPASEWALDSLVNALGSLGRRDELRALLARIGDAPRSAAESHARVRGLVWLGEPQAAIAAAREAVDRGFGRAAEHDLQGALAAGWEPAETERLLRRRSAGEPFNLGVAFALAGTVGQQGRVAEGLSMLDEVLKRVPAGDQGSALYVRAMYLVGFAEARGAWREVAKVKAVAPRLAGDLAVPLALFGDVARGRELAALVPPGSAAADEVAALAAWRAGDAAGALARLAAIEARDAWPVDALAPSYLTAEVSAAIGDWRGALAAVSRFRSLWPRGVWRAWAVPRATYLAALAHARLGDREAARAELARLLEVWHAADRGLPLIGKARELKQSLER